MCSCGGAPCRCYRMHICIYIYIARNDMRFRARCATYECFFYYQLYFCNVYFFFSSARDFRSRCSQTKTPPITHLNVVGGDGAVADDSAARTATASHHHGTTHNKHIHTSHVSSLCRRIHCLCTRRQRKAHRYTYVLNLQYIYIYVV